MTELEQMAQERAQALQELAPLTPAQRDVLVLLCKGLDSSEIAKAAGKGLKTVEAHRSQIRARLKMTMIEAAVLAAKAGLV
mgnify:FL=1